MIGKQLISLVVPINCVYLPAKFQTRVISPIFNKQDSDQGGTLLAAYS